MPGFCGRRSLPSSLFLLPESASALWFFRFRAPRPLAAIRNSLGRAPEPSRVPRLACAGVLRRPTPFLWNPRPRSMSPKPGAATLRCTARKMGQAPKSLTRPMHHGRRSLPSAISLLPGTSPTFPFFYSQPCSRTLGPVKTGAGSLNPDAAQVSRAQGASSANAPESTFHLFNTAPG